jgi:hypothetical protein
MVNLRVRINKDGHSENWRRSSALLRIEGWINGESLQFVTIPAPFDDARCRLETADSLRHVFINRHLYFFVFS